MNIQIIISTTFFSTSLAACSTNNKNDEKVLPTTEVQQTSTDKNVTTASLSLYDIPSFILQNINGKSINLQSFKEEK